MLLYSPSINMIYCVTVLSISRVKKEVFRLAFYFKWNYWFLIDNILSGTICLYCFFALFSNVYSKINFMAKNGSDPCIFYCKLLFFFFGIFLLENIFCFSLWILNYILWKFQNFKLGELVENLPHVYLPYQFFAYFLAIFTMRKNQNIHFF